jgi:hypothetical protein
MQIITLTTTLHTKRIKPVSMTHLPPMLYGQKETLRLAGPRVAAVLQYWVKEPPVT